MAVPNPLPVISGWGPGAYGIWGILVVQLFALLFLVVKNGPKWLDSWSAARRLAAEDNREDDKLLDAAKQRKESKDNALEDRVALAEKRMVYLISALGIVLNTLNRQAGQHPEMETALNMLEIAGSLGPSDDFSISLNKMIATMRA